MFFRLMISHNNFEPHRQQAVSGLTQLPSDIYEGSGQVFHKFGLSWVPSTLCSFSWYRAGFEYFANPKSRSDGFITWQMDDRPTIRMGAGAVGPDQGLDGSGVSARLIPEEPMVGHISLTPYLYSCRLCLVDNYQSGHVAYVIYLFFLMRPLLNIRCSKLAIDLSVDDVISL